MPLTNNAIGMRNCITKRFSRLFFVCNVVDGTASDAVTSRKAISTNGIMKMCYLKSKVWPNQMWIGQSFADGFRESSVITSRIMLMPFLVFDNYAR